MSSLPWLAILPLASLVLSAGCRHSTAKQTPAPERASSISPAAALPRPSAQGTHPPLERFTGLVPVRAFAATKDQLPPPATGDLALQAQGTDRRWYLIGLRQRIGVEHIVEIERKAPTGGMLYIVRLDPTGTDLLEQLVRKQPNRQVAFLKNGRVLVATNVGKIDESGEIVMFCGRKQGVECIEGFDSIGENLNNRKRK